MPPTNGRNWRKRIKKSRSTTTKLVTTRKSATSNKSMQEEFFGIDLKLIPTVTISSLTTKPATGNTSTDDEEELPLASCREPPKKKKNK